MTGPLVLVTRGLKQQESDFPGLDRATQRGEERQTGADPLRAFFIMSAPFIFF